jgi:hypothetical protein
MDILLLMATPALIILFMFPKQSQAITYSEGSIFFTSYINSLKENTGAEEIIQTDTIDNGYPAKKFESVPFEEKGIKGLIIRRNNASYFISAEFEEAEKNNAGLNKFLQSVCDGTVSPNRMEKISFSKRRVFQLGAGGY